MVEPFRRADRDGDRMTIATLDVLTEVQVERLRQTVKWGIQNHPDVDQVLMNRASVTDARGNVWPGGCTPERMAEHYEIPTASRAKFLCQNAARTTGDTYAHILVEEVAEAIEAATLGAGLRDELIQVAAVAVAWVEKIDREAIA
jgi:hypothetical protein